VPDERPVLFCFDGSTQARAAVEEAGRQLEHGRRAIVATVWSPAEMTSFVGAAVAVPVGFDDQVAGKAMEVADDLSIEALLATLGVKREFTAVAVNREIARRHEFESIRLKDGDRVEVVRPMGGGAR